MMYDGEGIYENPRNAKKAPPDDDGLDWVDIGLHTAGGVAIGFAAAYLSPWLLLAGAAFWLGREMWQHAPDFEEVITRPQSLIEWVAPVGASIAVFLLAS